MADPNNPAGGAGEQQITADDPRVKALIDDAVKNATNGLEANRNEVLGEKKKLQDQLTQLSKTWDGLDPEHVRKIMQRLENDEETRLIAEGKVDEVLARRTEALQKDFQKRLEAADNARTELEKTNGTLTDRIKNLVIDSMVRQAASEMNVVPSAIEDALFRAKTVFDLSDDDSLVARDSDGSVRLGKNGKDPLSPGEWLEAMKEKAPHWFPAPSGGGASGGGRGKGGSFTITRSQARDPQAYQSAKARAEQAGQSLQIVDDAG